ncbi:MAG TPA: ABC transporter permease [Nitrososphaerales archaeon]|nr:ABC transporter permease [Nitrososphaerales archaeon]
MGATRGAFDDIKRNARLYAKSKIGIVGAAIIVFFVVLAVFAPSLSQYDPVFGYNVASPWSIPSWAVIFPQYQGLAVTSFVAAPVDFGAAGSASAWTIQGANGGTLNLTTSPVTPPLPTKFLPRNPTGTLMVNATIPTNAPNGTNKFLPGGKVFFSMSQSFQWTSKPPTSFVVNATLQPVAMRNVSAVYLNYIMTTPTKNYTFSINSESALVSPQVVYTPSQIGKWQTSYISSQILAASGLPQYSGIAYPSHLIFNQHGTYRFTLEVQGVVTGSNPAISLRLASVSSKVNGAAFGVLGTDNLGRDVWSQFVWGARVSLLIGVLSGIGAVGLGTLLGIAAGYLGGFWDEALGRITDFVLVLPFLPLLIIITFILSQSPFLVKTVYTWIILIFTILSWPTITRIVRSQVLTVKERSYVEASRAVGGGTGHVLRKHILPNVTGLVYSQVALNVSGFILLEAALDFLTVSLYSPNVISWGLMLTYSLPDATSNSASSYVWWWFLPPGIAIAALSLAFVLVGFALDQVFNPRLRAR